MNNLWQLIKINLLGFYGINKIKHSTDKEEKAKNKRQFYVALGGMGAMLYLAFFYGLMLNDTFKLMKAEYLLLAIGVVGTSVFTLMSMFSKTNGFLFQFKDYDIISSFPVKNTTIVTSRIILIYIMSMINTILFMVPFGIIYILSVQPDFYFYIAFIISVLVVPLIPIIIGTFIGSIISIISSKFKKSNIFNIIFTVLFVMFIMYFSTKQNDQVAIYNFIDGFIKSLSKSYPFLQMYIDGIINGEILEFIKFVGISLGLFMVFSFGVSKYFNKINTLLTTKKVNAKYKGKKLKTLSLKKTLIKKEFKRYFASSIYVLNTGIGLILLVIACVLLVAFGSDKVEALLSIEGFSDMLNNYAPLVLSVFVSLSCTTSSSISLEGKNFWIIKTLPVDEKDILNAKVLMNFLVTIIPIIISSTIVNIYLKPNALIIILMYIIPLLYAYLIAQIGIILNIYSNSFDWKSEVFVVKQSLPAMVGVFTGMGLSILPIVLVNQINIDISLMISLLLIILIIINILLYIFINNKAIKTFRKING